MIHRFEPLVRAIFIVTAAVPLLAGEACSAEPPAAEKFSVEGREFFEKQVRPLLVKRCFECHGGTKAGGGGPLLDWQMTGTGALAGFNRHIIMPGVGGVLSFPATPPLDTQSGFEVHTAPRTNGNPLQCFDTDMFRLFSQISNPSSGDPDFDPDKTVRFLRETGRTYGFEVISMVPEFRAWSARGGPRPNWGSGHRYGHWNSLGHEIAARVLFARLAPELEGQRPTPRDTGLAVVWSGPPAP